MHRRSHPPHAPAAAGQPGCRATGMGKGVRQMTGRGEQGGCGAVLAGWGAVRAARVLRGTCDTHGKWCLVRTPRLVGSEVGAWGRRWERSIRRTQPGEKARTSTEASHRSLRNALPRPLPWYAPGTRPATSCVHAMGCMQLCTQEVLCGQRAPAQGRRACPCSRSCGDVPCPAYLGSST